MGPMLAWMYLVGCGDDGFEAAVDAGTPEALESYLMTATDEGRRAQAEAQLERLYLEEAQKRGKDNDHLGYAKYLTRFPEGKHRETAIEEMDSVVFSNAERLNTATAWSGYVSHCEQFSPQSSRCAAGKKHHAAKMAEEDENIPF